jgi:hypothetical protein
MARFLETNNMFPTARTVSDDHVGSARLGVRRMQPFVIDRGDRHRIYAVCVAVEVTLVSVHTTISASKYKDGSLPASAIVDTLNYSFLNDVVWALHGSAIVSGAPAAAVDGDVLIIIIQCSGLVCIRNRSREDTDACDFGIVSDAYATDVVADSGNLAGTASSMVVSGGYWRRQLRVVVEIVRSFGILHDQWVRIRQKMLFS